MKKNKVIFKGVKNGIIILLDKDSEFDAVLDEFEQKLNDAKEFFKNTKINIKFEGRYLSKLEYSRLVDIIINESNIDISCVYSETDEQLNIANCNNLSQIMLTDIIKRTIRSGQCIDSEKSIVILGDINPGSKVISKGNIIVLGCIKGNVYAGYPDNENAFIAASSMHPVQIRIGKKIGRCNNCDELLSQNNINYPQIAYVKDNNIHVDPIDYKSLNNLN